MYSAVFDIECTDLGAVGAGLITCVCIRPMNTKRTRTYHIGMYEYEPSHDFGFFERQERDLVNAVHEEMQKYHILIGHNIDKFDLPYLKSRAFRLGLEWNIVPFTYDTLKAFRRTGFLTRQNGFGKPSGSLAMVADFTGVKQEKTSIYPVEWWEQIWGNKQRRIDALKNIVDHCQKDVRLNANIWEYLWNSDKRGTMRRFL